MFTNFAVAVPTNDHITSETEAGLRTLEKNGANIFRVFGCSAIDKARSEIVTRLLSMAFDHILWVDSDIAFDPQDVIKLLQHDMPLVGGIYSKKIFSSLAAEFEPSTKTVTFGVGGGLIGMKYLPFGLVLF